MKSLLKFFVLAVMIISFAATSHAIPQLRVFDGTSTITVSDGGAGDAQPAVGQTVFVGALGNWLLNVHVGTTFPVLGTLAIPMLDLSFNATSIGAGGTLVVSFSADGFGPTSSVAVASIGGTIATGGTVTYTTYGGTNNTLFSTTNLLTSQGPATGSAFSGTTAGPAVINPGPYSLTQVIAITHGSGPAQTTGNALLALSVPDGGAPLLLLGLALMAGGLFGRLSHRRKLDLVS